MDQNIKLPNFVSFIASPAGRWLRIAAGLGMIGYGISRNSKTGSIVASVGLIPIVAGVADICGLGPVLGGPFQGQKLRQKLHEQNGRPELGSESTTWFKT